MSLGDVIWAAGQALRLLAAAPGAWLLLVLVYLMVVQGAMRVPRIGWLLQRWLAVLGQVPVLAMAATVAAGQPLDADALSARWRALLMPPSTQAVLALGPLLSCGVGLAVLYRRAGSDGLRLFFGHALEDRSPPARDVLASRLAMHGALLPFVFVPAAVVLAGQDGLDGLRLGLSLAWAHPWALAALGLAGVVFERLSWRLTVRLPRPWSAVALGLVLPGGVGFSLAWLSALSVLATAR